MSSHVTIDLGRGINKEASGSHNPAAPRLPFLRRRKGLVLIIVLSITLLLVINRSHAQSSISWVKDSMRPPTGASEVQPAVPVAPLPNDFGTGVAQAAAAAAGGNSAGGIGAGTDAFRKLAKEQGYSSEQIDQMAAGQEAPVQGAKPTQEEQILLFLQALANPLYEVPSWEYQWKSQLVPTSEKAFAQSLKDVAPTSSTHQGAAEDAALFKANRAQWTAIHSAQHPLTVFSKSYCPYSRRAKDLLTSLGAKYTVIEVDLRPHDAQQLQSALAALSGHHTFPAVFARGKLLGGYDDIQTMHQLKVLTGVLKGAGAL